jgi:hypothetical protein
MYFEDLAKHEGIISPAKRKKRIVFQNAKDELSKFFDKVEFYKDDSLWSWKTTYIKAEGRR